MGLLLVFAAGYVMGARAGGESLDEVIDAVHAIRESDEFHDLVSALRTHAADSLRGLATMLENGRDDDRWAHRLRAISSTESSSSSDCVDRDVLTDTAQTDDISRRSDSGLGADREPTCRRLVGNAVLVLERLTAGHCGLHQRTDAFSVVVVDHAEVSSECAFEIERVDAMHPMQFVAPLHGVAYPRPTAIDRHEQVLPTRESVGRPRPTQLGQGGSR